VASDLEIRQRIVDAAAELFAEHGYGGTRLRMVAERAGVTRLTVKRLTGGRPQLFAEVMAAKVTSEAADRVAAAAAAPDAVPPLSVLLEAAAEIFADPERSWNVLELEALIQAHRDDEVRALESARVAKRWANMKALTEQTRRSGGLDDDVDDDAFAHFALALSVGLAMVAPVVDRKPTQGHWNALMARIGAAVAPESFLLTGDHEARTPWRLRIDIPDRPGGLALLMRSLSGLHAYVLSAYVLGTEDDRRTIDVALTVPSGVSERAILAAAMAAGSNGYVTEGSPDDGLDLPTRIMDGATELVTNPGFAPQAAAMLVEADHFEVSDAVEGEDDAADILRLQWTADQHVVLQRDWAPFARAEKSRASALLRLAAAIASVAGDTEALGWVEPIKGGTVWIRLAHPGDADAVAAMHERCSEQSRVHRYFTEVGEWRDLNLRRITGGHRGATLVVMSEEGAIIGLGNVFPNAPDDSHAAEFAMIVEDAYQGRGVGTRLQRRMIALAQRLGFTEVVATVLAENSGMLHVLEEPGLKWTREHSQGVITLRAPLPAEPLPPPAPAALGQAPAAQPRPAGARRTTTRRTRPKPKPEPATAKPARGTSRVNKAWHQQHVLGSHARLDDRVAWHLAHAQACACRPIPPSIAAAIEARGLGLPEGGAG
jgi:AcrR family transcriptional regulator/RimJ/RimL family protein N-acetyltransferase